MAVRDVDSAETAFRVRAAGYAAIIAAVGAGITLLVNGSILIALSTGALLVGLIYFGVLFLAEQGGRMGVSIFHPSGSSTPAVRDYSLAGSLVARAQYEEAVAEYQRLSVEHPQDPEPRLRHARVLCNSLHAYEDAGIVLRQILQMPALKPEIEQTVLRELVELYIHKQQHPQRALPFLARIAEKFAGTPVSQWARREARAIKESMQQRYD